MGILFFSLRSYQTDILTRSKIWLVLLTLISFNFSYGQNSEIGLEFGSYNYLGDIVRKYDFGNQTFGAQFFLRKHVNEGLSQ